MKRPRSLAVWVGLEDADDGPCFVVDVGDVVGAGVAVGGLEVVADVEPVARAVSEPMTASNFLGWKARPSAKA